MIVMKVQSVKKKIAENFAKLIVLIIFPTSFIIIIIILLEIQNRNSKLLLSTWFYDPLIMVRKKIFQA